MYGANLLPGIRATDQIDKAVVLDAVRAINDSADEAACIAAFTGFIEPLGFHRYIIGHIVNPANVPWDRRLVVTNWPPELMKLRAGKGSLANDPIARCAMRTRRPFKWSDALLYATRMGIEFSDDVAAFGMKDGWMFPCHGLGSVSGGVSLASNQSDIDDIDIIAVEWVCQQVYHKLERLHGPFPYQHKVELTHRESEVVQYVAAGKSNKDVADILELSVNTINETLQRAGKKLQAQGRAQTVANAIARNAIFP